MLSHLRGKMLMPCYNHGDLWLTNHPNACQIPFDMSLYDGDEPDDFSARTFHATVEAGLEAGADFIQVPTNLAITYGIAM